jgi:hypothetical protein
LKPVAKRSNKNRRRERWPKDLAVEQDDIYAQQRNNLVKDFENFEQISTYLRDQWAGLFADFLSRRSTEAALRDLAAQVNGLSQVSEVLKKYTESIMRKVEPEESERSALSRLISF